MKFGLLMLLLFLTHGCIAGEHVYSFSDPADQQRFTQLTQELRCMVCQNESLDGSQSDLAKDLKTRVALLVHEHKTNAEIKQIMLERYGDYILYRPRFTANTFILWLTPILLIGFAMFFIRRIYCR